MSRKGFWKEQKLLLDVRDHQASGCGGYGSGHPGLTTTTGFDFSLVHAV